MIRFEFQRVFLGTPAIGLHTSQESVANLGTGQKDSAVENVNDDDILQWSIGGGGGERACSTNCSTYKYNQTVAPLKEQIVMSVFNIYSHPSKAPLNCLTSWFFSENEPAVYPVS